MKEREIARQMVHCSGVAVIFIAFSLGKITTGFGALAVACFVSFLSWWTRRKEKFRERMPLRIRELEEVEDKTHEMFNSLEREEVLEKRPYYGAFNFFLAMGLVLLIFPFKASILSVAIISVSDAASTLVGIPLGKHEIFYNRDKSIEGSMAFFAVSFLIATFFLAPAEAFLLAFLAAVTESLPHLNDNFSVPVCVGIVFLLL